MRRSILVIGLLATALLVPAAQANPWNAPDPGYVVFADDFESGLGAYTQNYPSFPVLLDTTKSYEGSQSAHHGTPTANSQSRMYVEFGGKYAATDEFPLVVRFAMDTTTNIWSTRQYIELRANSNSAFAGGTLQEILALGFTSSGVDTTRINYRVLSSVPGGPAGGWSNLTASYATRADVATRDWVRLAMVVKSNNIEYWVEDANGTLQLDLTRQRNPAWEFDTLVIGSGLSSAGADVWWDDLSVHYLPEPAMVGLLALGLPFFRRRRMA